MCVHKAAEIVVQFIVGPMCPLVLPLSRAAKATSHLGAAKPIAAPRGQREPSADAHRRPLAT